MNINPLYLIILFFIAVSLVQTARLQVAHNKIARLQGRLVSARKQSRTRGKSRRGWGWSR